MSEKADEMLIKKKVNECVHECWELMFKKSDECGIPRDTTALWLFFSRVNNTHYAMLNRPRITQLIEDQLK